MDDGPLTLDAVLLRLAEQAAPVVGIAASRLHAALAEREQVLSTALPDGIAVPHAVIHGLTRTLVVPAVVRHGVHSAGQDTPTTVFISLFGDASRPWDHVKILARVARIAHNHGSLENLRACSSVDDLVQRLAREDAAHV